MQTGRIRGAGGVPHLLLRFLPGYYWPPTYRSIRVGSGWEQVFGGFLTDSGGSKEERGLPHPTPFTKWIGADRGGFEAGYIFLSFWFPLTAPFGTDQGGSSTNPDPFTSLDVDVPNQLIVIIVQIQHIYGSFTSLFTLPIPP